MTDNAKQGDLNANLERSSGGFSGYLALLLMLLAFGLGAASLYYAINTDRIEGIAGLTGSLLVFLLLSMGFYMIQPNQGVSITLFGAYKGTDRHEGLR